MIGREFFDSIDLLLVAVGVALVLVTIGAGWLRRLNVGAPMLYVAVGLLAGPAVLGLAPEDPLASAPVLEHVAELAVIMSLIVIGIRIARPISWKAWQPTIRLILIVMPVSIAVVALTGHWLFGLAVGPALLLGAIVAPTDPILAGPLEEQDLDQEDDARFGLSGEAGLNDGFAFPFIYLGLHATFAAAEWRDWVVNWALLDLLYGVVVALPVGWFIGQGAGRWYRREHELGTVSQKRRAFTPLAILLLTYGLVEVIGAYGFLAAFTVGLGFRRSLGIDHDELEHFANFTEAVDELIKAVALIMVGALLRFSDFLEIGWPLLVFGLLLFVVTRPVVTWFATAGGGFRAVDRVYWGWFGIRGIGSIFYLCFAIGQGIPTDMAELLFTVVVGTVLLSLIVHGTTVRPFMRRFEGEADVEL